jgi:hypothetical protein
MATRGLPDGDPPCVPYLDRVVPEGYVPPVVAQGQRQPPAPPISICDATNPDEMLADASEDQLFHMISEICSREFDYREQNRTAEAEELRELLKNARESLRPSRRGKAYAPDR